MEGLFHDANSSLVEHLWLVILYIFKIILKLQSVFVYLHPNYQLVDGVTNEYLANHVAY